jgi:LCP family protein required for cell wall assembly
MPSTAVPALVRRLAATLIALALVGAACSDDDAAPTTTVAPTTAAPTTTSLATTTTAATTTTDGRVPVAVNVADAPDGLQEVVAEFYDWIANQDDPRPKIPNGLAQSVSGVVVDEGTTIRATAHWALLKEDGRSAAVVVADDDVILAADQGSGWKVYGAHLARWDLEPWFGEPVRHMLAIGTDARPGQDQEVFRADSIHIMSSNLPERGGSIIGFPRDSYVPGSRGNDKFTHINTYDGPEGMVDTAETVTGLEIEGYVVTGFLGFIRLVNDFGGVEVDVPFAMADHKSNAYFSAGPRLMWGDTALAFNRNRSINGGDFTRSFHHGLFMQHTLMEVLQRDITVLPDLLAVIYAHAWTNLQVNELLTLGATAFYLDSDSVENVVLRGSVGSAGGASVVFLSDSNAEIYDDVADDGMLTVEGE